MRQIELDLDHQVAGSARLRALLPFLMLAAMTLCMTAVVSRMGLSWGLMLVCMVLALPLLIIMVNWPRIAVPMLLGLAFTMMILPRMGIDFPVGTIMDAVELILFTGLLIKQRAQPRWRVYRNPVTVMVLLWIAYNLLEVINPEAASKLAWVYTVRTVALVMLLYFVFLYYFSDLKLVRIALVTWILLCLAGALYGLKQEFAGFAGFEQQWLDADPVLQSLYHIDGHWRTFSFFADPVTFAYNMVLGSILCFALVSGIKNFLLKILAVTSGIIMFWSMLYSGTRGAYVLMPAALGIYAILKMNGRVLAITLVLGGIIGALVFMPTSNPTLKRFQSAFWPEYDASYNVRKNNQMKIQPYIRAHLMGGGLGATGTWGRRFSPDSYLANFPPDSGYVRVAVELGWAGLLLFCTLMFTVLRSGIINYFKVKDPSLKRYGLALVIMLFVLNLGNFPQEALVQYPSNILCYMMMAMMMALPDLDWIKQKDDNA